MPVDPPLLSPPDERPLIIAYEVADASGWEIAPASYQRRIMDETPGRGAYRCLPLSMANQAGWFIHSPVSFNAIWDGGVDPSSIKLTFDGDAQRAARAVVTHFGTGIVTIRLPFIFRTPPGIGLLVRGAPNWPVTNFSALEGMVETDWNPASFTMNWKIVEPGKEVRFEKEWPACFIQPFDLNLPEKLGAARRPLADDPATHEDYIAWRSSRDTFMNSPAKVKGGWQKDYFQGYDAKGKPVASHRTNFQMARFERLKDG